MSSKTRKSSSRPSGQRFSRPRATRSSTSCAHDTRGPSQKKWKIWAMTLEDGTAQALASDLCAWIDRLFPDADRGERFKRTLRERFGDDARGVTDDLCREVEAVAHEFSRHFALEYVADGSLVPDRDPPGWPPQDAREVRLRAGSVGDVTRRDDGIGVVALDGLDSVHLAAPYLRAAFALLRDAGGVV